MSLGSNSEVLFFGMSAELKCDGRSWLAYIRSELMDVLFYERVAKGYRIPIKRDETRLAFGTCLLSVCVHVLTADYQLPDSKQSARGYRCAKVL